MARALKLAAFIVGLVLGYMLTVTKPVESAEPSLEAVLVSCLNGGMVVDGELWVCHKTGVRK